jgi:hypothetical protein
MGLELIIQLDLEAVIRMHRTTELHSVSSWHYLINDGLLKHLTQDQIKLPTL